MSDTDTKIGALLSCAQNAKRNRENWGRSEYVRWRDVQRRCGREIAQILADTEPKPKPLNWRCVSSRLDSAASYSRNARVMSEMQARAMVLEVLRSYGIQPTTEEEKDQ